MSRYSRDELLDFERDFDLAVPEQDATDLRGTDDDRARFMGFVEAAPHGCWEWCGAKLPKGYGFFTLRSRRLLAHRAAHEMFIGPIPDGMEVDHLCGFPSCVNPEHLEAVPQHENWRRSAAITRLNAEKTHCPRGHEYSPENTRISKEGWRRCRACDRLSGTPAFRSSPAHPPSEQDTAKRAPRDVGERPGRAQPDLGRHGTPAGTGRPTRAKIDERRVRQELYGARGLVASSTVRPPVAEDAS